MFNGDAVTQRISLYDTTPWRLKFVLTAPSTATRSSTGTWNDSWTPSLQALTAKMRHPEKSTATRSSCAILPVQTRAALQRTRTLTILSCDHQRHPIHYSKGLCASHSALLPTLSPDQHYENGIGLSQGPTNSRNQLNEIRLFDQSHHGRGL